MKVSEKYHKIEEIVETLVLKFNYLPLAYKHNLATLLDTKNRICRDIDCIRKKAVEVLTQNSEEAELYRQAIYRTLALYGFSHEQDMYVLGRIAANVLRKSSNILDEVATVSKSISTGRFRKSEYKLASKLAMDLVMLNFCYVLPHYTHSIVASISRPLSLRVKPLGATIQSLLLREKIPVYRVEDSVLDVSSAESIVDFSIKLRQFTVRIVLEDKPRRLTDLYVLLSLYVNKEAEERGLEIAKRFSDWVALIEATVVPYYLAHYEFLKIDATSLLFFELKYM
ncbi:MAG: hypothetical protein QW579_04085 [Desulfurococcaceae archaeon]